VRPQRGDDALLGEQRREDPARQVAEPVQGVVRVHDQLVQLLWLVHPVETLPDVEELPLGPLVDVPLETAALRVPGGHEALTRHAQRRGLFVQFPQADPELLRQPDVVQRQPCLRSKIAEEVLLRGREGIVRGLGDDQVPDRLPLVADRDRPGRTDAIRVHHRPRPALRPLEPAGQAHPHRCFDRPDPASGRLGHLRQDPVRRHGVGDPLREAGDHLVGRSSLAVDQSVREAARTEPHRLEQHRHEDGSGDRERGARRATGEASDPHHDRGVDGRDENREQREDHRLRDHDVDVIEVVAQDRHTGREGDQGGQQREDRRGPARDHHDPDREP
jgi:hypothetical protein